MKNYKQQYLRLPLTEGWEQVVRKLETTGGWRLRQAFAELTEEARMNFSAVEASINEAEWPDALVCIEDGLACALKLREVIAEFATRVTPTGGVAEGVVSRTAPDRETDQMGTAK